MSWVQPVEVPVAVEVIVEKKKRVKMTSEQKREVNRLRMIGWRAANREHYNEYQRVWRKKKVIERESLA